MRPFRPLRRLLSHLDAFFDRVYGWRYNPLYQSGTIAVLLLVVLIVTGTYLLLFYRIGSPYASVERIQDQVWTGRWIRALHRYASDAAVVAIAVHALRMFLRGRSWGPRALAWVSGVGLLGLIFVIALTGFVMVWDVQGRYLAMEGARLLDALPIFSEPVARAFTGERPMPGAFFFLNYFLHIAVPLGIALFLYLHVARIARPRLLPPRGLAWGVVGGLTFLSVLWPAPLPPRADPSLLLQKVPLDWFFGFWVPVSQSLSPGLAWLVGGGVVLGVLTVPLWSAPRGAARPGPSTVEERHCTGCVQCTLDCPYDAITMVPRTDGRQGLMASVTPEYCVSCGICAGSCAPMSIGPPGRTGRDQLVTVRRFLEKRAPGPRDVVLLACARGAGEVGGMERFQGAMVYPADCIGSVHTSVAEYLLRGGAGGVLFAACPERDCWNREGTKWARARLFEGREAELKERVDRNRLRFFEGGAAERGALAAAVDDFRELVHRRAPGVGEQDEPPEPECERPAPEAMDERVEAGS
ncbi:MAG: cytochrome b N-terminal domain-containing protein [Gemmatimonadota bacterium]